MPKKLSRENLEKKPNSENQPNNKNELEDSEKNNNPTQIKKTENTQNQKTIDLFQESNETQKELARLRLELNIESGTENILEEILTPEQVHFFEKEKKIKEFTLESNGKINAPEIDQAETDKIELWKSKEGVIDVSSFGNILVVIYNSEEKVPEGCRDLKMIKGRNGIGRAGEYNPKTDICSIDISSTYDYLNEKYRAEWVQGIMRHEIRHGLVHHEDIKYNKKTGKPGRRNSDKELLEPEVHRQLTYLDELHGQYFDVLEGEISGRKTFRNIDSAFYSVNDEGSHLDIASESEEGKKAAKEIFYILQGFIVSKRMAEKNYYSVLSRKIDELSIAAGTVLATERSLPQAEAKIKQIWNKLIRDEEYKKEINQFLKDYKPDQTEMDNTPELDNIPPNLFGYSEKKSN